jgi:hypothetical protein
MRFAHGVFHPPLSLALSREGRGKALIECIQNFSFGCAYKLLSIPLPNLCIPSPLAGEGQGEGDVRKARIRSKYFSASVPWIELGR